MKDLKRTHFEPLTNQKFHFDHKELGSIKFNLQEVKALPVHGKPEREPFTLLFTGPSEPVLDQQIVPLKNDELGQIDVFLVPVGSSSEGMQYEAVFT